MDSLTLKGHKFFQIKNNGKATHSFAPRPLIFKLQQEFGKCNNICLSWSSLKNDLQTIFFKLLKSKF